MKQDNDLEIKIINILKKYPKMDGLELASKVSTKKNYFYGNHKSKFKLAVLDLGNLFVPVEFLLLLHLNF